MPKRYELISYCLSELPSKFNIENNDSLSKFTFDEISKQNITSQQLYLWSIPIDIIERYQFYLNQLTTTTKNDLSLGREILYNCTYPRFGPICQYELYYSDLNHFTLYEIIRNFYRIHIYDPTNFTCYIHLNCNRGIFPSCLDWTEICDGKFDCLNGPIDEEHCWQLEINQCKDNEYRCTNGQCISQSFYHSKRYITYCIDKSDKSTSYLLYNTLCSPYNGPSFQCEDISCHDKLFTSSCFEKRTDLLIETMHSDKNNLTSENCWLAFKCLLSFTDLKYSFCDKFCERNTCINIVQNTCPDMLYFPNVPVLFGNVYFSYKKTDLQYWTNFSAAPLYICYDKSQYDDILINISKIFFNRMTCIHSQSFWSEHILTLSQVEIEFIQIVHELYHLLKRYHLNFNYTSSFCNRPNMYQCIRSSKCISIYRLMDTIYDCPHMDDENITLINNIHIIEHLEKTHLKCPITDIYIHQSLIKDDQCDCPYDDCKDEDMTITYLKNNILFQQICDGFIDLLPIMIDGQNETDETECKQWKCNNIYTRCNNIWNCPNGADESGCVSNSLLTCSSEHHLCVLPDTNKLICLSIEKMNDGNVDCLGATDEPILCGRQTQITIAGGVLDDSFYCTKQSSKICINTINLCDEHNDCEYGDDEQFCTTNKTALAHNIVCFWNNYALVSDVEKFLCQYRVPYRIWNIIPFKFNAMSNLIENKMKSVKNRIFSSLSTNQISDQYKSRCHRGLDLRVWLNNKNNLTKPICLCPSSYYGDICQYQNERISLTVKFRAVADSWQTLFAIIISLISDNDERIIHSYEQLTLLPMGDCQSDFDMYLLYSTQPKDSKKNYSIHIDIYEKMTLNHRGSILYTDIFPFLPVNRLAFIVDIPSSNDKPQKCSNNQCIYGKCIFYLNNPKNLSFCQCDEGWSGQYCTIQHNCTCASNSLCIGITSNNRSICVCPINKFGPRCLINDTTCQIDNSPCQNNGQCISNINYMVSEKDFFCICPKGFTGSQCQTPENKLILSFQKQIDLSQHIFIHFIKVSFRHEPIKFIDRTTTFRTIPARQDSVIIYWSQPFHFVFIELSNKTYYMAVIQENYEVSKTIIKMINPSDRCPHISELFNKTFVKWHLIRRIKYYHIPCEQYSLNLSCFYDDVHFCFCYNFRQQRLANCFNFDHNMTYDCRGQNKCENDGECFQDHEDCPQKSICVCSKCYYGRRCQFSTSGFGLSLDSILSYHILSNVSIIHQTPIVKTSLALTIIFVLAGFINSILAMITFKSKNVRQVGCGIYLFGSSLTSLFTMIIFGLKFFILLLAQMTIISNELFLKIQCISLDFFLRTCLFMDQWLNACVAMERATTAIQGAHFNKKKSRKIAKLIIIILLIIIIGTCIHEPIHRRLIEEENDDRDEKRIWCIITYSSSLQIYNSVINIFHFISPFIINLVSSIMLIIIKTRRQSKLQVHRTYKQLLLQQVRQHKHLLTAPIVLVILALPRLIITFISKCMRSAADAWLFLIGYFISFVPPILTFLVFVLPSKFYKQEFRNSIIPYRTTIQRRLGINS